MLFLVVIILIGIIYSQSKKIESLNAQIFQLKKELSKLKSDNENKGVTEKIFDENINNSIIQSENSNNLELNNEEYEIVKSNNTSSSLGMKVENANKLNDNTKPKIKYEKKEKMDAYASRNLSILITGSILIVLAAIVFLSSAWHSIPAFLKTTVLFLVAFVFLGASKISKEKYKLEKASKTFFYIGMAYLPICLLSISILGLFGTYLSVNGEGKYIYLGFSTLILSVLYYFISKKSNDRFLFYGSLLSQIFSVILFTLMFEERLFLVYINLLLYNLLLLLIIKDKIFEYVTIIIPGAIALGTAGAIGDGTWYFILTCLLLSINFLFLEIKKTNLIKAFLFNISLFGFFYSLIFKESFDFSDGICQVLATLFTFSTILIENFVFSSFKDNKNLLISCRVISIISIIYIYIGSFVEKNMIIASYLVGILLELLLIYDYKSSKNYIYKYLAYAFTNIIFIDIHNNFFKDIELINYIPMFTTTLIMLYEMYSPNEKDNFISIYSVVFEAISLIVITIECIEVGVVLAIIFAVFSLYYNKKMKINDMFNIVPLLCVLYCIMESDLNEQLELGIMILSTIGLTFLSVNLENINVYTIVSGIYSLILGTQIIDNEYLSEILYIIWGMVHIYFYRDEKIQDGFKILTVAFINVLYYSIIDDLDIEKYTLISLLGISISGMYFIHIISKYYKDIDIIEYAFWGTIYLYALSNYSDSKDGILFSILIMSVIFFSYYKKYGATFLASIIAILVNGFALTKEFWFSIPWWIYLLVVGGSLIGFAVKNEANENKEKITVGSVLKKIKESAEK